MSIIQSTPNTEHKLHKEAMKSHTPFKEEQFVI
jgi:hypothetical protein